VSAPVAGVWTPWAEVLCRNCHDALKAEAKREIKWPDPEKRLGDDQGFCTACGAEVWVHEDIAQLTRLLKVLGTGELEQTGGMCSALTIARADGGTVVVTNMDGPVMIGIFHKGEWGEGQEAAEYYNLPLSTPDDLAAAIIRVAITQSIREKK